MMPNNRPDVTKAQGIGILLVGVPIISNLLAAFGFYHPSPEQQDALKEAIQWGSIAAGTLFAGDAGIRHARNRASAATTVATINAQAIAVTSNGIGIEGVIGESGTLDEVDLTQKPPDADQAVSDPAASGPTRPTAA